MLAQMLLTVSAKMLSCQSYILSFIFWIWRKRNKKVKPLLALRYPHGNILDTYIFVIDIGMCYKILYFVQFENALTKPLTLLLHILGSLKLLSVSISYHETKQSFKKNAKIHRVECINMFASLKTKIFHVFYASLTCSLSRYSARSHAVAFEYFNNFATKCRNVLLNLVHIILSDTFRLCLALLYCYVASHQISHYLLFGVQ